MFYVEDNTTIRLDEFIPKTGKRGKLNPKRRVGKLNNL